MAAVNPIAGLGTLLAGMLLRQPLIAAATREYRVSGGWAQPKIVLDDGKASAIGPPGAAGLAGAADNGVTRPAGGE